MSLGRTFSGVLLIALLPVLAGCQRDGEPVAVVQAMATALGKPKTLGARAACMQLVELQQNRMGCDNVLLPLLHYAPGFAGSKVSTRGYNFRRPFSKVQRLKLRYESPVGRGNLDAMMQREDGKWKVFSLIPIQ